MQKTGLTKFKTCQQFARVSSIKIFSQDSSHGERVVFTFHFETYVKSGHLIASNWAAVVYTLLHLRFT